jgi:GNAT superfamily N-acetyltransferase
VDYRIDQVGTGKSDLLRDSALLSTVFPTATQYTEPFLRWEYLANPEGPIVGYNAFSATGEHAAHYVTQPIRAVVLGKLERGLLSFNTATHPEHQGRGLFTLLADATFSLAKRLGFTFVVGVANANSTPGFTRKLGFSILRQLEAKVGIGYCQPGNVTPTAFHRVWSAECMEWRLSNPTARYCGLGRRKYSDGRRLGFRVQVTSTFDVPGPTNLPFLVTHPITLWLGLARRAKWVGVAVSIPQQLRPSPLNLIFKDLTAQDRMLADKELFFEAIDFDAY